MIVDEQDFCQASSNDVRPDTAGTCLALTAYEFDDVAGNEAEMVVVSITARRL